MASQLNAGESRSLGAHITHLFRRYVPDPLVISVLLFVFTLALALALGTFPSLGQERHLGAKAVFLLDSWRGNEGLWKFLAFSMQMCLVLVTGHALAASEFVSRLIRSLASAPKSAAQASAMVALLACMVGLINWGLGLVFGAILAREVGRSCAQRGVRAHYPLLVASAYTCMMVWHGGLSGSAPLSMTTRAEAARVLPAQTLERLSEHQALQAGGSPEDGSLIGLGETTFSPINLAVTGSLLVLVPLFAAWVTPRREQDCAGIEVAAPGMIKRHDEAEAPPEKSPAALLERSPVVSWVLALLLIAALWRFASTKSLQTIGLNEVNIAMLALGLIAHGSPMRYIAAAEEGAKGCAGIILQFPLYAGTMGVIVSSGLAEQIVNGLTQAAPPKLLPLLTYFAACVFNVFVPSGGGQWGVQGPVALESAMSAGIAPGRMVLAVAYGDQTTNMLQPFWALPLLAITGVRARDIVGDCAKFMVLGLLVCGAALLLWPG